MELNLYFDEDIFYVNIVELMFKVIVKGFLYFVMNIDLVVDGKKLF